MTFRYTLTVPATGSHKIPRFKAWLKQVAPEVQCNLPPQVPIESETLTVRLSSIEDRDRLRAAFPATLP